MSSNQTKAVSDAQRKLEKIISNYKTHLQAHATITGVFLERIFEIKADLDSWRRFHHPNTLEQNFEKEIFEVMSQVFTTREKCKNMNGKLTSVYEQMVELIQAMNSSSDAMSPPVMKRDIDPDSLDVCDCDCMNK